MREQFKQEKQWVSGDLRYILSAPQSPLTNRPTRANNPDQNTMSEQQQEGQTREPAQKPEPVKSETQQFIELEHAVLEESDWYDDEFEENAEGEIGNLSNKRRLWR